MSCGDNLKLAADIGNMSVAFLQLSYTLLRCLKRPKDWMYRHRAQMVVRDRGEPNFDW